MEMSYKADHLSNKETVDDDEGGERDTGRRKIQDSRFTVQQGSLQPTKEIFEQRRIKNSGAR